MGLNLLDMVAPAVGALLWLVMSWVYAKAVSFGRPLNGVQKGMIIYGLLFVLGMGYFIAFSGDIGWPKVLMFSLIGVWAGLVGLLTWWRHRRGRRNPFVGQHPWEQLDSDLQTLKRVRLPWWGVLLWMAVCAVIVWLLNDVGRFNFARPVLCSVAMLGIAIAIKWKLRRRLWFWITVIVLVAIHSSLILLAPWTTKWIPALVVIPFAMADLYAMLAVIAFVEKIVERRRSV